MRHRPARHRNGYHKTRTRLQRPNRWLLGITLELLAVGINRCTASMRQPAPASAPVVLQVHPTF
jgi:hypothetical protein